MSLDGVSECDRDGVASAVVCTSVTRHGGSFGSITLESRLGIMGR